MWALSSLARQDLFFLSLGALALALSLVRYTDPRARRICFVISALLSIRYVLWRVLVTLNHENVLSAVISSALVGAEIYGVSQLLFFYAQTWAIPEARPSPPLPRHLPSVDVFITICDEPTEILFRTAVSCLAMDYPRKTVYILDDGGRKEVQDLARRLGCVYLARGERIHAKAGNLNHALTHSSGDLVAVFDVDHVPVRSFLRETVGFFADPRVAFVQTPHTFYNPEPFQRNLLLTRQVANEQDLFYRAVLPGRDRWNAAFFCGSAAVFRRSALEAIGGFKTDTVTEDFHTSLHLHARGYRSIYLNRPLSRGLAPEDFSHYVTQRLRWARGALQALRLDNPLVMRGLTLSQRLLYLHSIFHFFFPIPRLVYTFAPLAYLLAGIKPMVADVPALANYFLAHYLVSVTVFDMFNRGLRGGLISNAYELSLSFFQLPVVVQTLIRPRGATFRVTPKGIQRHRRVFHAVLATPPLLTGALLIAGMGVGIARMVAAGRTPAFVMVNVLWAFHHLITCGWATAVVWERPQRRTAPRVTASLPVQLSADWLDFREYRVTTGAVRGFLYRRLVTHNVSCQGRTLDISETGASILLAPRALPPVVTLSLDGDGRGDPLAGEVVACDLVDTKTMKVGLRFVGMTEEQRRNLIATVYGTPEGLDRAPDRLTGVWTDVLTFLTGPLRSVIREQPRRRRTPRVAQKWMCVVTAGKKSVPARVKDISLGGACVVTSRGISDGLRGATLKLMSPQGRWFCVPSSVKRIRRGLFATTVAVEFRAMGARERARLALYLYGH